MILDDALRRLVDAPTTSPRHYQLIRGCRREQLEVYGRKRIGWVMSLVSRRQARKDLALGTNSASRLQVIKHLSLDQPRLGILGRYCLWLITQLRFTKVVPTSADFSYAVVFSNDLWLIGQVQYRERDLGISLNRSCLVPFRRDVTVGMLSWGENSVGKGLGARRLGW